ncbi:MAG: T9SS type A sorting domain-containing protein [Ignavibacteria bacterium]|nr:T9SS type A sorting domain-containing protein [Ignavibacteria bacterium]
MENSGKPLRICFTLILIALCFTTAESFSQFTWSRTFGGSANDEAFTSLQTRDGNYLVVGDSGYGASSVIIKYSKQGDVMWKKIFSGGERVYIRAAEDPSGNLYFNTADGILKISQNGNTLWRRTFSHLIGFQYLKFTEDFKYLICYGNNSAGKVDSSGNLKWYKEYQNTAFPNTFVLDFLESGNSYYFTGIVQSTGYQGFIRRLDTAGNEVWSKYTAAGTMMCSIVKVSAGSFIVSGNTNNFLYCRKFDASGVTKWERTYNSDSLMNGYAIVKAGPNRFALATGGYGINSRFVAIDSSGTVVTNKVHYYPPLDKVMYLSISSPNDSGFILTGYIKPQNSATFNWLVVKTDKSGNTTPIGIEQLSNNVPTGFKLYQNYPNPFNPVTRIKFDIPAGMSNQMVKFSVFDILGRKVHSLEESKQAGSYELSFDAAGFASGTYFYSVEYGEFKETRKMIILK